MLVYLGDFSRWTTHRKLEMRKAYLPKLWHPLVSGYLTTERAWPSYSMAQAGPELNRYNRARSRLADQSTN